MIRIEPALESKIIECAKSGNRAKKIAEITNLPEHFVRKVLDRHNIKVVAAPNSSTIDLYKIIAHLIKGVPGSDIAREFKVTRQYIALIKKKCISSGIELKESD